MTSIWVPRTDGRVNITDGAKVAAVRALLDRA
ncbi:copper homeostasis protein CutC [Aeromonas caviae]